MHHPSSVGGEKPDTEFTFMDDKFSVTFAVIGAVAMKGASFEQILNFVTGLTAVEYESIMLAWKEKVEHNLIRPTHGSKTI